MPRVLTARFMHETNTFSRVKTDMALIQRRDFHLENEIPQAFRGTRRAEPHAILADFGERRSRDQRWTQSRRACWAKTGKDCSLRTP